MMNSGLTVFITVLIERILLCDSVEFYNFKCNNIYHLSEDRSYLMEWSNQMLFDQEKCMIGVAGLPQNVMDRCRVCVERVERDVCTSNVTIEYTQRSLNSHDRGIRNSIIYNCSTLPFRWCGELDAILYISIRPHAQTNSLTTPMIRLKVTVTASNIYMKSVVIILALVFGAIVITFTASCVIRWYTRRHGEQRTVPVFYSQSAPKKMNQRSTLESNVNLYCHNNKYLPEVKNGFVLWTRDMQFPFVMNNSSRDFLAMASLTEHA